MFIDKLTPAAPDAERALLGGLLQEPGGIVDIDRLIAAEDFFRPEHGRLYVLLQQMLADRTPIDLVTVARRISSEGGADLVGGLAYVAELPEHCPSTANLAHYAELVRSASLRRRLAAACVDAANAAYDDSEDPIAVANGLVQQLLELTRSGRRSQPVRLEAAVQKAEDQRWDQQHQAAPARVTTGFRGVSYSIDTHLGGGFKPGQLVVIAGATSMGKTGLAIPMASAAARSGRPGLYVTCEMDEPDISTRIRAFRSTVPTRAIEGDRTDEEERLLEYHNADHDDLWIWHRPGVTLAELRAEALRLWASGQLHWLMVDYLQIMGHPMTKGETRAAAIGHTVIGLKTLAGELGIPVVVLSQLNREFDRRPPPRGGGQPVVWTDAVQLPQLSDLAESGAIEHGADVVLFPANAERYGVPPGPGGGGVVIIGKQRNGPRGMVPVIWDGACACYRPLGSAG